MVLPAITPLSWEFTARWFASIGGADQRQPGTETEQERGGVGIPLTVTTAWCSPPMARRPPRC